MNNKDIKILENMLNKESSIYKKNRRGNKEIKFEVNSNYYKAIENLLTRYKQLKKENEEWQRAYQEEKDKQFELLRENKELKEDNEQLDATKNEAIRRYNFETIPKSKVEEKLEEQYELFNSKNQKQYSQEIVDVLEELLGEE